MLVYPIFQNASIVRSMRLGIGRTKKNGQIAFSWLDHFQSRIYLLSCAQKASFGFDDQPIASISGI